jgi:hypothetical protein
MHFGTLLYMISGKILAIIVGLFFWRRLALPYRLVFFQVIIAMITEIVGRYIAYILHKHNLWLFNYYWVIDMWMAGIVGYMLVKNQTVKNSIPWLLGIATIVWLINILKQGIDIHPTWAMCIISITIVIIYFPIIINSLFSNDKIISSPEFWLSFSLILFFGCSIPLYGVYNYLYETNPLMLKQLFNIIKTLNFIRYPLIALAFYLYAHQQKTLSTVEQ